RPRGLTEDGGVDDLAADVSLHSRDYEPGQIPRLVVNRPGPRGVDAELVVRQARGDVGVRLGVDIRVDTQGQAGGLAGGPGRRRDLLDLPLRLRAGGEDSG